MKQTLKQVSEATGISRFTLSNACKRGAIPATRIEQKVGSYYEIDTDDPAFVLWLTAHQQKQVSGRKIGRKKQETT